jgi:hypothetical protein
MHAQEQPPMTFVGRLREPRRLAAIIILALTGGIILAVLYARGELAGADALAYWAAVRGWLAGANPFEPPPPFMPYAYAPWTLYLFLPWAMLPWSVAWFVWRMLSVALFAWSVAWAYQRRPLATAITVALLGAPLAANLDTGNVGLLLVLGVFAAQFTGPRVGGLLWALAAALKWLPALLIVFLPPRARLWGIGFGALAAILALATWPLTLQQIEIALNYPRPLRLDYLLLLWAAVPWLWRRQWPLRFSFERMPRSRAQLRLSTRRFFGYAPGQSLGTFGVATWTREELHERESARPGSAGTSMPVGAESPPRD